MVLKSLITGLLIWITYLIWKFKINIIKIILSRLRNFLNIKDDSPKNKSLIESFFVQIFSQAILTFIVIYIGIFIWQHEINIKKTISKPIKDWVVTEEPFEKPNLEYELYHSWGRYREGLKVYGIKWKDNYILYDFIFRNNSRVLEVENIKLEFEFPIIFVACKEIEREGVDNVLISDPERYINKGRGDTIVDMIKLRTNFFTINISKAYPYSYIHFKIFLKRLEKELQQNNKLPTYFTIKYHFAGKAGKKQGKRIVHPINVGEKLSDYSIDTSKTFTLQELKEGTPHVRIVEPIKPVTIEGKRD